MQTSGKFWLFLFLIVVSYAPQLWGQPASFVRYPALSPDGQQLAFVFQGDIWVTPLSGGPARRLTIHQAYDQRPVWSPDNQQLAFSSDRFGNNDVYLISAAGSAPQRITYHPTQDYISSWSAAYGLLMESNRTYKQVEREAEIVRVAATGGTPYRAFNSLGFEPQPSPDGRYIAFVRGTCRIAREAYQGSANRDIWLYDSRNKSYTQLTTFAGQDFNPRWADDNTLLFISARSGKYNIYRVSVSATGKALNEPQQLTNFTDYGVMAMDIGGNTIVMEQYNKLWQMPVEGGQPQAININLGTDYRFDPVEHKTYSDHLNEYAVSPNGKLIAMVIRGEVFVKENDKEKARAVKITNSPYRDKDVAWLNDTSLLFTSDREGKYNLYLATSADPKQSNLFKTLKIKIKKIRTGKEDISNPVISPDGKKLAYNEGRGKLITANISATGEISGQITLLDGWATASGVSWSPDAKWLAYSLPDLDFNAEIYIHAADNSRLPVNISMHPKRDANPVWSKDGSKLGFLSARNNGDVDVWFAWLRQADWEKTKQDWEEEDENKGKEDKQDKSKVAPVRIDFTDIHYRLSQVTALPGNESNLAISDDGEYFFYVTNANSRQVFKADQDLYKIKWDGSEAKALTRNNMAPAGVTLGPQGKKLYFMKQGGKLAAVTINKTKVENLAFRAAMDINHPAERAQIFAEAWRTLNAGFYDPGFHGRDFSALKKKYREWALSASTKTDFYYVFNLLLGQLNASHMGIRGTDLQETQKERNGLLGVDILPLKNGVKITRVIPRSPAAREASKLSVNEVITAIDGQPVSAGENFYAPLVNKVNEKVILQVTGSNGKSREVVIRPTGSLSTLLYEEWVAARRKLTDQYSGGKLGYIHIRGMNWTSFEQFERELMANGHGKQGLVIDVRFNGGGWTTDYLMTVLNVRQHAYTIPRGAAADLDKENQQFRANYPFGERLPLSAWVKPAIALCNANSYSNAEIFSHAFKTLNRGKLVGMPTFGAVISTGGQRLIDGSLVRLPFRAWYVLATGKSMENIPAVPDIILDNRPDSKAKGVDEQLKKAVDTLLGEIK